MTEPHLSDKDFRRVALAYASLGSEKEKKNAIELLNDMHESELNFLRSGEPIDSSLEFNYLVELEIPRSFCELKNLAERVSQHTMKKVEKFLDLVDSSEKIYEDIYTQLIPTKSPKPIFPYGQGNVRNSILMLTSMETLAKNLYKEETSSKKVDFV